MTEVKFDWTPTEEIGPFKFGKPVSPHVDSGLLEYCPELSTEGERDCYQIADDDDPTVYSDHEGAILYVLTDRHLLYRGEDLLGLHIDEVIGLLGQEPDEFGEPIEVDDDDVQITAEFDALGLQLWLRDGIAVGAIVSAVVEED